MSKSQIQRTVAAIFSEACRTLFEYEREHSCIDGGALLIKALHGAGLTAAYRLTVGVHIHSKAPGGGGVILGRDAPEVPEGRWPGHLTVIVPKAYGEHHALLDPTITQVNSAEDKIELPPLCFPVASDFVSGTKEAILEENGVLLIYKAYPDDDSYNQWGDYLDHKGLDEAAAQVLARAKPST